MRASKSSDAPPPDAFEVAVRLLSQRAHSELELRQKLGRRGCLADDVDRAVGKAHRLGYLNDAAFAHSLMTVRARTRGPALVAAELAAKGIDRESIREVVESVSHEDQVATARRLAARALATGTDRRLVAARLARRGFPGDVVREALALEE